MKIPIRAEIIQLTWQQAENLLLVNEGNRNEKPVAIADYHIQMVKGDWIEWTGETLKFTGPNIKEPGRLLDGQNRLTAQVRAKKTYHYVVIFGVPPEAFTVLDTGVKRTAADALHISGVTNSLMLSGMIRSYLVMIRGRAYARRNSTHGSGIHNRDILETYNLDPDWWQEVAHLTLKWTKDFMNVLKPNAIGGFYALFYDDDQSKCKSFMEKLCTGVGFRSERDPVRKLRDILQRDHQSRVKLPAYDIGALIIKAWIAYKEGKLINSLTFNFGKEAYPKLKVQPKTKEQTLLVPEPV